MKNGAKYALFVMCSWSFSAPAIGRSKQEVACRP